MAKTFDCSGWATRHNIRCADGRTICKDAFKHNDGQTVPLVWNHSHNDPLNVLGHALLENREEGVYAYCKFNDTTAGKNAKKLVKHGDVVALSIYANQLKQQGGNVIHGSIRELSLVLAGANPGAYIDTIMSHGEECEDEMIVTIYTGEGDIDTLAHADEPEQKEEKKEDVKVADNKEKTVKDVFDEFTEEQKTVVYAMIGQALEDAGVSDDDEGDDEDVKHNLFEGEPTTNQGNFLSHSDQAEILGLAKQSNVGKLSTALAIFAEENDTLAHGIDDIELLFPEFKDVKPGAPELIERDQSWVAHVMQKVHKSPISRIRTRQADARIAELRAKGYQKKGDQKTLSGNIKLIQRTTDPQTVYRKDELHRDDIVDITDFDVVEYNYKVMKHNMEEELALAFLIGDGREDIDPDKIHETHIRSIWNDEELYTIHHDVDIAAAKAELQGTNTSANFGDNYVYAEAVVTAALYSREKYKGSGNLEFFCTPHLLNVMLLARDLNGRRIYDSKADLQAALNVSAIHTVEQFEGKTRVDAEGKTKKLLGLFVNLNDYQVGATKGGELTKFNQFDIDFNKEKFLLETRLSGALTKIWSAIALEEPVSE